MIRILLRAVFLSILAVSGNLLADGEKQVVEFGDDIEEQRLAIESEYYELDVDEIERVRVLRVLDKPFSVDDFSSIELLGKYATSEEEREKYARAYLEVTAQNSVRSSMWALAIQKVSSDEDVIKDVVEGFPEVKIALAEIGFSLDGFGEPGSKTRVIKTADVYVSLDCKEECFREFGRMHTAVMLKAVDRVNVVFVGSDVSDQDEIYDWARARNVTKEQMMNKQVQLHFDGPAWAKKRESDEVPQTVR